MDTFAPLLTSASRGWNGIALEMYHFVCVDRVVPMPRHVVGVHLTGSVNLRQSRGGRTWMKHVRAGDITLTPAGEPKRFQHSGDNVVLLMQLEPALIDRVARERCGIRNGRLHLREEAGRTDPALVRLAQRLLSCLGPEGEEARLQAEAIAEEVALHLALHYAGDGNAMRAPTALAPHKLQRALEFIEAHLRDDFTLAEVAAAVVMSPGHFAHAFKASTGVAPHRFVVARRMELAKSMLRQTDLPVTEIAHEVRCASPSHFSVIFLRYTGRTPRDYRGIS